MDSDNYPAVKSSFSSSEAFSFGLSTFSANLGYCVGFLLSVEVANLVAAVMLTFLGCAFSQVITQLDATPPDGAVFAFILFYFLARMTTSLMVDRFFLALSEGRKLTMDEVLGTDYLTNIRSLMRLMASNLIFIVFSTIGTMLFVVPGVVVAGSLRFNKYFIVEQGSNAVDGLRESYELAGGHTLQLTMFTAGTVLFKLLGILCLGLGFIPARAISGIAEAYAYRRLMEANVPANA